MTDRRGTTSPGRRPLGGARAARQPLERPAPLRQAVYDALAEMIINRELQPGEHLVENELAAHLGVSRQPVREALQRLHNEGWVDLRPALGAFVHVPTEEEADQLLATRTLLETESARLAAKNATPEQIERLRELQRAGEEALSEDSQVALVEANAALHAHLVEMSGNKVLAQLIGMVDRRVRWYYSPIARSRGREAWDEHAALIDVIAEGNTRRAGELMRKHTERTRESYHQRRKEADEQEALS
ncbi:GntR family transcriptional regulator [Actinoplanes italicus]|uniref:GntR family transcriptional regulator n=1 Tax=Actinoplanes italicus TaxID=113567 RepID=A0A2T0JYS2_9ACTN|nr:GntR family transcriptional regulator [Actinoplanes italicus]PRX14651.1 GntR family transcriptional regulator [Actinoplanes italicus]GIE34514.1 GntR family transcriptional regulator [Actinoplanes italicus]